MTAGADDPPFDGKSVVLNLKRHGIGLGQSVSVRDAVTGGLRESAKAMRSSSGHPTMSSLEGMAARAASVLSGRLV